MGLSYALNYGINKCEYNLIARMDSDDIMMDNRLDEQYKHFKNNPDAVLGTGIQMFDHDTGKVRENKIHPEIINSRYVKSKKVVMVSQPPKLLCLKKI